MTEQLNEQGCFSPELFSHLLEVSERLRRADPEVRKYIAERMEQLGARLVRNPVPDRDKSLANSGQE